MLQRCMLLILSLTLCGNVSTAFAQVDPRAIPVPKLDRVQDEVQKQLERLLDQIGQQDEQAAAQLRKLLQDARQPPEFQRKMRQPFAIGNPRWGGLQFKKVDAELREKLGLPDNEGLVVLAVDPNSPADKAGLKANDVIVKLNDKPAPSDPVGFAELVKAQKASAAMDIVVVRDGKEETLKGVAMPQAVQPAPLVGRPGFGGPKRFVPIPANPFDGNAPNIQMQANINGTRISRKQVGDEFFGSYEKNDLKITLHGKIEGGKAIVADIMIQEGKESKKYAKLGDVPAEYRIVVMALTPQRTPQNLIFPPPPPFDFPDLKLFPGIDGR